jgi:hypothetical protein
MRDSFGASFTMGHRESLMIFSALGLLGCCYCLISRKCGLQKKEDDEEEAALICENNSTKRMKQVSSLIAKFEAL